MDELNSRGKEEGSFKIFSLEMIQINPWELTSVWACDSVWKRKNISAKELSRDVFRDFRDF